MKDPPDIILRELFEDDKEHIKGKKAYFDYLRENIREKKVRRKCFEDMFFFGKGFREASYYNINQKKNGKIKNTFDGIATRRLDPRNLFVDENANELHDKLGLDGARDLIYRDVLPLSTYIELARAKGFDENVEPENWFALRGMDYIITNQRELMEKILSIMIPSTLFRWIASLLALV